MALLYVVLSTWLSLVEVTPLAEALNLLRPFPSCGPGRYSSLLVDGIYEEAPVPSLVLCTQWQTRSSSVLLYSVMCCPGVRQLR